MLVTSPEEEFMSACALSHCFPGFEARIHPVWPILAMVGGFALWWPLGLMVLVLWKGPRLAGLRFGGDRPWRDGGWPGRGSGNSAFDEHRAAVLRRLEEERRVLDAQQREFAEFLAQLKRAKDREEF